MRGMCGRTTMYPNNPTTAIADNPAASTTNTRPNLVPKSKDVAASVAEEEVVHWPLASCVQSTMKSAGGWWTGLVEVRREEWVGMGCKSDRQLRYTW